jgi:hypothetical protein
MDQVSNFYPRECIASLPNERVGAAYKFLAESKKAHHSISLMSRSVMISVSVRKSRCQDIRIGQDVKISPCAEMSGLVRMSESVGKSGCQHRSGPEDVRIGQDWSGCQDRSEF